MKETINRIKNNIKINICFISLGEYEKIILLSTSVYGMWKQQKLNELKFQNENYLEINLTIAIHFVPWGNLSNLDMY